MQTRILCLMALSVMAGFSGVIFYTVPLTSVALARLWLIRRRK